MRLAIIGAGPAGLTAAYQLAKAGKKVEVFEASGDVGGMSKTLTLWGQKVDTGPHRYFSNDARINRFWLEVVQRDYAMVDRLTRIYYGGKFFQYPLKPMDALRKLGLIESSRCMTSYAKERFFPSPQDGSFQNWVTQRFGSRLFEIFFKSYSEKLWGLPCTELDADFAAQRIKKLNMLELIKNALLGGRGNTHKTLVDRFAYPIEGTGMVYERMAAFIQNNGGIIHRNRPVARVLLKNQKAHGIELKDGSRCEFDHILSTMPLTLMVKGLDGVPESVVEAANSLQFRNTILVYLNINSTKLFPDNWLYVHAPQLLMGRVTNFRNWVPSLYGDAKSSILALEYWCFDNDAIWSESDSILIQRAEREIVETGLVEAGTLLEGHVYRIPRCYPVYRRGYKAHVETVAEHLKTLSNLTVIGRYGAFKYNNQDHSILMGLLAAENILQGSKHDLWSINTDYDNYQESSTIAESGLVPMPQTEKALPAKEAA